MNHLDVGGSLLHTGSVYLKQGKHDEALAMYEEALEVFTRALGFDNEPCARAYYYMVMTKHMSGDIAGAVEDAREAVRIYAKHGIDNEESRWVASVLRQCGGKGA